MFHNIQVSQINKVAVYVVISFTIALVIFNVSEAVLTNTDSGRDPTNMDSHPRVGGLGNIREKDDEVVEIVNYIKPILEERAKTQFDSLEVISYKHQIVQGINYFVKVKAKVGDNESIIHLRIYKKLNKSLELTAYELDKEEEEELKYFQ